MYFTLFTAVALFVAPALADFAVNSPELKQCETTKITWQPTKGPYNVIITDANDPCGEPLAEVGDFTNTWAEWKVTIPAQKIVQISIADADDQEAWSRNITVGAGASDCLTAASAVASSTTTAAGSSTTSTTSTTTDNTGSGTSDEGATTSSGVPAPVGAANAGSNSLLNGNNNAAPASHALSAPAMVLSLVAAVAALAL